MPVGKPYPLCARNEAFPMPHQYDERLIRHHVRIYENLKDEVLDLFKYIEPNTSNFSTYSIKIHSLLVRICIEVEGLFKSIFIANGFEFSKKIKGDILLYSRIEKSHRLSDYAVSLSALGSHVFSPFESFKEPILDSRSPSWYKAYNATKHDSYSNFSQANLENLLSALSGLFTVHLSISGKGFDEHVSYMKNIVEVMSIGDPNLKIDSIKFYTKSDFEVLKVPFWSESEKYSFDWSLIIDQTHYQKLQF